jgi:hypothetical protein
VAPLPGLSSCLPDSALPTGDGQGLLPTVLGSGPREAQDIDMVQPHVVVVESFGRGITGLLGELGGGGSCGLGTSLGGKFRDLSDTSPTTAPLSDTSSDAPSPLAGDLGGAEGEGGGVVAMAVVDADEGSAPSRAPARTHRIYGRLPKFR